MTDHYTSLWSKQYGGIGGDTFQTWAKSLAEFSAERILRATNAVIKEGAEFPPNLIKFLRFCREQKRTESYNANSRHCLPPPMIRKDPSYKEACLRRAQELGCLPK